MKKLFRIYTFILLILSCLTVSAYAQTDNFSPTISNNWNSNNYTNYSATPVTSNLVKEDKGYMRVEKLLVDESPKVLIGYFNDNFEPTEEKIIDVELPIYGGFYSDGNNYYIASGQKNFDENDAQEVVRVTKYNKNWDRISAASLYGANTISPFEAGSLRMTHSGNNLYVRTCHQMYQSSDGLRHQANLALTIDVASMEIIDKSYLVSNYSTGYVSHSFNQFVLNDNGNIIGLDHGDAYPRGALLGMYGNYQYADTVIKYAGETGQNVTNASIGGLEASASNYLTAGNSSDQSSLSANVRNIYVTATPKSSLQSDTDDTQLKWLTNYTDNTMQPTTPHLVKFDDDNFLVLWSDLQNNQPTNSIFYVLVDGNANPKGAISRVEGMVSDCKPIIVGNKAVWYAEDGNKIVFNSIDLNGNFESYVSAGSPQKIYRLYNTVNGEHLYTPSPEEVSALTKDYVWKDEGTGWKAPAKGQPVYRLYNDALQNHLYTTDTNEVNVLTTQHGWTLDFSGQPIFMSGGTTPIYRVYNEALRGLHHLTTDENEYNTLPTYGWIQEGVALYGVSTDQGINEIIFNPGEITIGVGETVTIPFTVYPQTNYSIGSCTWTTFFDQTHDDKTVTITGKSPGTGSLKLTAQIKPGLQEVSGNLIVHVQ